MAVQSQETPATLNTRRIVVAAVLGAVSIVLGLTGLGLIPMPNQTGAMTILHVPAIIGAVLEGPVVGIIAGAIFGIFSMMRDTTGGLFSNPLVAVLPRVMIGITSWLAYRSLVKVNVDLAAVTAGVVGTLTNTILVLTMLFATGLIPIEVAGPTILSLIPQIIGEVLLAAIITPIVVRGVNLVRSGRTTASEQKSRDDSHF